MYNFVNISYTITSYEFILRYHNNIILNIYIYSRKLNILLILLFVKINDSLRCHSKKTL